MRITSWLKSWNRRRQRLSVNASPAMPVSAEQLETRSLLSVSVLLIGGQLDITSDANDNIRVSAVSGNLLVETAAAGDTLLPFSGLPSTPTSSITSITITGGDEENSIDLGSVLAADFTSLSSISVQARNGADTLLGSPDFADNLQGEDGDDILDGQGGDNTLDGGDGRDVIRAGAGIDLIDGGDGSDDINGGAGNDSIDSGNGGDSIVAGLGDDNVYAGNGEDSILGGDGNDTLNGDGGTDTVDGELGDDSILGGDLNDSLLGSDGNDTINGQSGNDSIDGGVGNDALHGSSGQDLLIGSIGDDTLNGNGGHDTLQADDGNDLLYGGTGDDSMRGGSGLDTLNGQAGNDTLQGELDTDVMNGGTGDDLIDAGFGVSATVVTQVSVSNVSIAEGNAGVSAATFTISLSQALTITASVDYSTTAGSATAVTDFVAQANTLTFPAGITTQTVTVLVNGDLTPEASEFFFLDLSNPVNVALGNPQGICQITNDESTTGAQQLFAQGFLGEIFRVNPNTAATTRVGNTGFFATHGITTDTNTGILYGITQGAQVVTINTTTGVGTFLSNISAIPQGQFEGDAAFDAANNVLYWLASTDVPHLVRINPATGAAVDLGQLQSGGAPLSTSGSVNADSCAFRGNTLYAVMTDGLTGANANLNDALVTIDLTTLEVTLVGPLGVSFAPGGAGLTYDISSDAFYFSNSNGSNDPLYRVDPATGTATLVGTTAVTGFTTGLAFVGAPTPPVITIGDATITEDDAGTTSFTFSVALSRPATTAVTVQFATEPGSALQNSDYVNTAGTLTFAAGQSTQTITVRITNDLVIEVDESFFLRLSNPIGADLGDGLAIAAITDNDVDRSADSLFGDEGSDTLIGGAGDNIISGGSGNDSVNGGNGNDNIVGGSGADTINGDAGDDTLNGQGGTDVLEGGAGTDTFVWEGAASGNDTLTDASGDNALDVRGNAASNIFDVTVVDDKVRIAEGSRSVTVGRTFNTLTINAGAGDDTVNVGDLSLTLGVVLTINGEAGNDLLSAVNNPIGDVRLSMDGGNGNDSLYGGSGDETLRGGTGSDFAHGGAGNDTISGGTGNDLLVGSTGDDSISGDSGFDSIRGNEGDDVLNGGADDDTLNGGTDDDTLNGDAGDDSLVGDFGNDSVLGGTGLDAIFGNDGDDTLDGGRNDDVIAGGTGDDKIRGNHGNDSITGDDGADTINGGDGNDTVFGGIGSDALNGGDGDDIVNGNADSDTIIGGDGQDTLRGGGGNDVILGQDGDDNIDGQSGVDTVAGNQGADTLNDPVAEIDESFTLSAELFTTLEAA